MRTAGRIGSLRVFLTQIKVTFRCNEFVRGKRVEHCPS